MEKKIKNKNKVSARVRYDFLYLLKVIISGSLRIKLSFYIFMGNMANEPARILMYPEQYSY